MRYLAIIPAYNPGGIMLQVIEKTLERVDLVLVVDDGCDESHKNNLLVYYNHEKVQVLAHKENMGKGHALITGFKEALEYDFDYLITLDSDGQHLPEEIDKFKERVASDNEFDLIIGEREVGGKMPWRSNLGNTFTAKLFYYFFHRVIGDTQSGYRLFSKKFVEEIVERVEPGRYETEMKVLIQALLSRKKIDRVRISTVYFDNNKGSKFRPVGDSMRVIKQFALFSGLGFSAWVLDYAIFTALSLGLSVYFLWAHFISKTIAVIYYFYVNKYLVFKSKGEEIGEARRYLAVVAFNILITAGLLYGLVSYAGLSQFIAKPMVDVLMFTANFFILKSFVYESF